MPSIYGYNVSTVSHADIAGASKLQYWRAALRRSTRAHRCPRCFARNARRVQRRLDSTIRSAAVHLRTEAVLHVILNNVSFM